MKWLPVLVILLLAMILSHYSQEARIQALEQRIQALEEPEPEPVKTPTKSGRRVL